MKTVVLINEHLMAANGLGSWLDRTGRFNIIGTAKTLADALLLLETLEILPQIVILDPSLGTDNGLELIPLLKEICVKRNVPLPGILVYSTLDNPFVMHQAMEAGADAYASKPCEIKEILWQIR